MITSIYFEQGNLEGVYKTINTMANSNKISNQDKHYSVLIRSKDLDRVVFLENVQEVNLDRKNIRIGFTNFDDSKVYKTSIFDIDPMNCVYAGDNIYLGPKDEILYQWNHFVGRSKHLRRI